MNATFRNLLALALASLTTVAGVASAQDWTLSITAPDKVAPPATAVTYSGTLTNNTGAPLPFDVNLDFGTSPALEQFDVEFAPEFANLGLVLPATGYTGPLFKVTWTPNLPGGSYGAGQILLTATTVHTPGVVTASFTLATPTVGPFCQRTTGFSGVSGAVAANDSTGQPFGVYNTAGGALSVATFDGYAWSSSPILAGIGSQASPAVALDTDQYPHVAFYDAVAGRIVHAWNPGTGWQSETVDAGNVGASPSLHIDRTGVLHVSYYDVGQRDLKYASKSGAAWVVEVVDTAGTKGENSSVFADVDDQPYIAYYDGTAADLKLARRVNGLWQTEIVDSAGSVGAHPSLNWRNGVLSIAYRRATTGAHALMYATGTPGSFASEVVDAIGDPGLSTALDVSDFGQPRIAYFDAGSSQVKYASKILGAWTKEAVGSGATATVTMDRSLADEPFMSWVESGTGQLRFAALISCIALDAPHVPDVIADGLSLSANHPNPFTSSTVISFAVSRATEARVRVYDTAGRLVAEPLNRAVDAGRHDVVWNGTGRSGHRLAPGAYITEVRAAGLTKTSRVILLR